MEKQTVYIARYVMESQDEIPLSSAEYLFSTKEKAVEWLNSEAEDSSTIWMDDEEGEVHYSDAYKSEWDWRKEDSEADDEEYCEEDEDWYVEYDECEECWHLSSTCID